MPLPIPNLDDRTFDELVAEGRRRLAQANTAWNDLSPSDPGMMLLELFAYLTEGMLYRLNRLPEKAYVAFLRLMGVTLAPPAAARTRLRFARQSAAQPLTIPRGTRVAVAREGGDGAPVVFVTRDDAVLAAGRREVEVEALHCQEVAAEEVGIGTGLPGQQLRLRRPPVIAPSGDERDLVVAVEVLPDELDEGAATLEHAGVRYRLWREVPNFSDPDERHAYLADRQAGIITFAPAARRLGPGGVLEESPRPLAAVPPEGRRIVAWYRRGGGPEGNVAAGSLSVLKDSLPGVRVTNPLPATGGAAAEDLANALVRGPQELHSLQRAVTARDFELVALASDRGVARARAVTSAAYWRHAPPGEAEVVLVPAAAARERADAAALRALETADTLAAVQRELDRRRPLGSSCKVRWAQYKTVRVEARVVTHRFEDAEALRQRVLSRLSRTISPLPGDDGTGGWPFGQTLRASHVYETALAEPAVRWVDAVRLWVDEVPGGRVSAVAVDPGQPGIWYAASGSELYRTVNDGVGWEPVGVGRFRDDEEVTCVAVHPERAGLLAVVTRYRPAGAAVDPPAELPADASGGVDPTDPREAAPPAAAVGARSRLYLSRSSGEDWAEPFDLGFEVEDAAWLAGEGPDSLLLATAAGLYLLDVSGGGVPDLVVVAAEQHGLPLYAVASAAAGDGHVYVAVAAQQRRGVYLASRFRDDRSFRRIDAVAQGVGIDGEDVRTLAIQRQAGAAWLWAGSMAAGREDLGRGGFRWYLRGDENPPEGWEAFAEGWRGGSCHALAFLGSRVVAASDRRGVYYLDTTTPRPAWQGDINSGLPRTSDEDFPLEPVRTLAARRAAEEDPGLLMAGTAHGVFRSSDGGARFVTVTRNAFEDRVTVPPTWLLCSGEHVITVVREEEVREEPADGTSAGATVTDGRAARPAEAGRRDAGEEGRGEEGRLEEGEGDETG